MARERLTETQRQLICRLYGTGNYSYNGLSKKFGVSYQAVRSLVLNRKNGSIYKRLDDDKKNKICQLYKTGKYFQYEIANILNLNRRTIYRILKENNIYVQKSKLTEEELEGLIEEYKKRNKSLEYYSKRYNISSRAIMGLLNRRGIDTYRHQSEWKREYELNENYFDKVNSEDKAYFLGLLYADGCNYYKRGCVSINLQEEDKNILYKFNEFLQSNRNLKIIKAKNYKRKNQFNLVICNTYLSKKLNELGCVPSKSLKLEFPKENQVPIKFIRHFIRGYFDGDGSIGKRGICITSTRDFCVSLSVLIKTILNINSTLSYSYGNKGNTITTDLNISGRRQVKIFLDWLYKDSTVYLERKYKKYVEYYANKNFKSNKKLTSFQVKEIRQNYSTNRKLSYKNIGDKYEVNEKTINDVLKYRTWKNI